MLYLLFLIFRNMFYCFRFFAIRKGDRSKSFSIIICGIVLVTKRSDCFQAMIFLIKRVSMASLVITALSAISNRSICERGDIKLLLPTGIIICSLPGKTSISSNRVVHIVCHNYVGILSIANYFS